MHGRIIHYKINNMHLKNVITRNWSERSCCSALQDHIAKCRNKPRLCMMLCSNRSSDLCAWPCPCHETGCSCAAPPKHPEPSRTPSECACVPAHSGRKGDSVRQLIHWNRETHALLKHRQDHYNNAYSFLLKVHERITCHSITDCIINFHSKDFEQFLLH